MLVLFIFYNQNNNKYIYIYILSLGKFNRNHAVHQIHIKHTLASKLTYCETTVSVFNHKEVVRPPVQEDNDSLMF